MPGSGSIHVRLHAYCSRFDSFINVKYLANQCQRIQKNITTGRISSIWRNFCCAALAALLVSCSVTPVPLTDADLSKSAEEDRILMFGKAHQITGSLSLEEAIARAVKHNLDHRAKAMEQALALNQLDLDDYELLPTLTAKAGYSDRNMVEGSPHSNQEYNDQSHHYGRP